MKNNTCEHITGKELDGLLNEAFLNLDFENNVQNKQILSLISQEAMSKRTWFDFLNSYRLNVLFFFCSVLICLTSLYRYVSFLQKEKTEASYSIPQLKNNNVQNNIISRSFEESNKPETQKAITVSKVKTMYPLKRTIQDHADTSFVKNSSILNNDSLLKSGRAEDTIHSAEPKPYLSESDSLKNTTQTQAAEAELTLKRNIVIKPSKSSRPPAGEVKAKAGKRKKGRLFHKDGTFRMKGRAYGKSRHPYHR